jgi:hypothetical protein
MPAATSQIVFSTSRRSNFRRRAPLSTMIRQGPLQLAYDAARKAALALLTAQGLRATTNGGHKATAEAAAAQFDGTFDRLDRMRRRRNDAEYPDIDTPDVTDDDANDAIESAQRMHDAAVALIASGKLGVFAAGAAWQPLP